MHTQAYKFVPPDLITALGVAARNNSPLLHSFAQGILAGLISTDVRFVPVPNPYPPTHLTPSQLLPTLSPFYRRQGSGAGGFVSFTQSQWWHADILELFTSLVSGLGIPISRGYARQGPALLAGPGARHASMTLVLARCPPMVAIAPLITQ